MDRFLQALMFALALSGPADAAPVTREEADAQLRDLDRVIARDPDKAEHLVRRADVYYLLNDMHRAVADYSAALKLDDRQDSAYFGRGIMTYGRMGLLVEGNAQLAPESTCPTA